MEKEKVTHLLHIPWTGLGLYNGFRGNRWLRNRIKVFKQFVVPSLLAQTNKNFILWCAFRREEQHNQLVIELKEYLDSITEFKTVFTYSGIAFYDDKYPDDVARERLLSAIHGSMGELLNVMGESNEILLTIQPSDDCYHKMAVSEIQRVFKEMPEIQAVGFQKGYIMNYLTKELKTYNPLTNPPFYTIRFPREVFIDPLQHVQYTYLKQDMGKYKSGTPIPSHEYVSGALKYAVIKERGFLVGTHSENVSTVFNHPYAGEIVDSSTLDQFGLYGVEPLKLKFSIRKRILRALPPKVQRKIRYWFGELFWSKIYNFLRT